MDRCSGIASLARLREDTPQWWAGRPAREPLPLNDDEQPAKADRDSPIRYLTDEFFDPRRRDLRKQSPIREQAFGEALSPDKLDRLGRSEIRLDRTFERMLATVRKLKDLRRPTVPG